MSKPSDWKYGDSWEKYPIETGQIWTEEKTKASFSVHDILNPLPRMMLQADMVYCDPPWNLGTVNSFLTKNGSNEQLHSFSEFYRALFECILVINPDVCYLEIGKQYLTIFEKEISNLFPNVQTWQISYYRKNVSYLIRGGILPTTFDYTGKDDSETPFLAIENEDCSCVADLCTGRGLTAISAFKQGKQFVGTELNKRRMAVTIDKITAMGGNFSIL